MNKVFKIDGEIVGRITNIKENEAEARVLRDLWAKEAEVMGSWLLHLLKVKEGDKISAGQRTDDNGRLFMWIIVSERVTE